MIVALGFLYAELFNTPVRGFFAVPVRRSAGLEPYCEFSNRRRRSVYGIRIVHQANQIAVFGLRLSIGLEQARHFCS